jgi:hypothetical protein
VHATLTHMPRAIAEMMVRTSGDEEEDEEDEDADEVPWWM